MAKKIWLRTCPHKIVYTIWDNLLRRRSSGSSCNPHQPRSPEMSSKRHRPNVAITARPFQIWEVHFSREKFHVRPQKRSESSHERWWPLYTFRTNYSLVNSHTFVLEVILTISLKKITSKVKSVEQKSPLQQNNKLPFSFCPVTMHHPTIA